MSKGEMTWDLSQLVENTDPAWIQKNLDLMVAEAEKIRDKYYGKITGLDAKGLLELLEKRDSFYLQFEGVANYCNLMYSADSTDSVAKQLNEAVRRASMKAAQLLAFTDLDMGKLLAANPSLVTDTALAEYRHYLEKKLKQVPYMLSEIEERLILMKDKNGIRAWEMLQREWRSTRTFEIEVDGRMRTMPYGEIVGLYQSPNRDLRKRAYQIVYDGLGKDEIVWSSAVRAVCEDHLLMCDLRKYPTTMTQSLLDNDVPQEAIDSLMRTILKNAGLYQRYLRLKAKLLGLDRLANYDILAPLPKAPKTNYSWHEAQDEILSAYRSFDEQIGAWVEEMYQKRHIDAEVRKGKESGAFCSSWLSGKSAYMLQSFNEKMSDVYAQAHELGHAVHSYILSRSQKPSNCEVGSCAAETGSIFGELLLAERLLTNAKTKEEKQAILTTVLDEFGVSAFQVSARVFFEQSMYDSIKGGEALDGETVAKLWMAGREKIFGDAVDWLEVMKWEWTKTPHYFIPNYRFYNYPYVFAQLFVFALYQLYKEQGQSFVPKLKKLLATGSSKSPHELALELGLDITTEEFWQKGMKQAERFISLLEETL